MARSHRKKKVKLPFWKKIKNPELRHIAEHIGKITDHTSWKDLVDVALAGLCAYAGWKASDELGVKDIGEKLGMASSGAIAYKLATSGNLVAGASGTAVLGAYGLIDIWNPITDFFVQNLGWRKPEEALEELGKVVKPEEWLKPEHWKPWIWESWRGKPVIVPP